MKKVNTKKHKGAVRVFNWLVIIVTVASSVVLNFGINVNTAEAATYNFTQSS